MPFSKNNLRHTAVYIATFAFKKIDGLIYNDMPMNMEEYHIQTECHILGEKLVRPCLYLYFSFFSDNDYSQKSNTYVRGTTSLKKWTFSVLAVQQEGNITGRM